MTRQLETLNEHSCSPQNDKKVQCTLCDCVPIAAKRKEEEQKKETNLWPYTLRLEEIIK